ncbi:MAG: aldehyde dehydrogenase family protein [Actinomycetia bacterium]|nr:aldehyde dehydrogenase family protein [Actinomycetes bacterium]
MGVVNPYNGEMIGEVASVTEQNIDNTLAASVSATRPMKALSAHQRADLLERAALKCDEATEYLARLVVAEQGKTITEARGEAGRLGALLRYCAGEARRIEGTVLPLDGSPGGEGRLGFTLRQPAGVVAAITPFNYPLLLVAHKVGPALAAGNPVVVKPASYTPLSALAFMSLLLDVGFPEGAIGCITGPGGAVGARLCADDRVRVVSFTGSAAVGKSITEKAGVKRLLLELGANCPVVVLPDADLDLAAFATAKAATVNAGQVCISAQRVLVDRESYSVFLDALAGQFSAIRAGDPTDESTHMGPMISSGEADRVRRVIADAETRGAVVVVGGEVNGALHQATVVADVPRETTLFSEELFGPAVGVVPVDSAAEAIELCNQTSYGLGAGVFTRDIDNALRFAREVDAGNVHINWGPLWRVDPMPYGGLKGSGIGKEGPKYAIEEMTESKTVVIHPG